MQIVYIRTNVDRGRPSHVQSELFGLQFEFSSLPQGRESSGLSWFLSVCSTSLFENTMGKGEIARDEQFLLFPHSVFYSFGEFPAISNKFRIVVCKLFQFGKV